MTIKFKNIMLGISAMALSSTGNAAPEKYEMDETHTTITASWDHGGYSRQAIEFTAYESKLCLDFEDPTASIVEVTFNLSGKNYWLGAPENERFENHMASGDLLNIEEFPTAKFVATSFETEDNETGVMHGQLILMGVSKPVSLNVTLNKRAESRGKHKVGFSAKGTMKRSDWGVDFGVPNVSDEIELRLESEMVGPAVSPKTKEE